MKTTFVYKKTNDCEIKGDFYAADIVNAPLLVYIHGGGLVWGTRTDMHKEQIARYNQAGYNICSIDYRLAPETKLPETTEDIKDAFIWLKNEGEGKFEFDAERIAVIGSSAGGFLALLSGTFDVKPKVIVSFYGYGSITGEWYMKPSPHFTKMTTVPEALARQLIQNKTISEAPIERRYAIYLYCRQQGKWLDYVTDWDATLNSDQLRDYCPVENIDSAYPTTLLLHGDADEDVPYDESVKMNKAINQVGGNSQLITIPGGKHSFDQDMSSDLVSRTFDQVIAYLNENL